MYSDTIEGHVYCNGSYSAAQKKTILIVMASVGVVSLTVCLVSLFCVICTKLHKNFAYRMAMYQVLASMLVCFSATISAAQVEDASQAIPYHVACLVGAFLLEYFMWVKLLFAVSLVFHLSCLAVRMKSYKRMELVYFVLSFITPLLFTWVPFFLGSYDVMTEPWCWIGDYEVYDNCSSEHSTTGVVEQFSFWYGPLTVCIVLSSIAIIISLVSFVKRYCKISCPENDPAMNRLLKKYMLQVYFRKLLPLAIYPIIFFLFCLLPLASQTYYTVTSSSMLLYSLSLAQAASYSLNGLFSSLLLVIHVFLARRLQSWNEYFLNNSSIENFDPTSSLGSFVMIHSRSSRCSTLLENENMD